VLLLTTSCITLVAFDTLQHYSNSHQALNKMSQEAAGEKNTCGICTEPMTGCDGNPVVALFPCGHLYDESCWDEWCTKNATRAAPCCICQKSAQHACRIYIVLSSDNIAAPNNAAGAHVPWDAFCSSASAVRYLASYSTLSVLGATSLRIPHAADIFVNMFRRLVEAARNGMNNHEYLEFGTRLLELVRTDREFAQRKNPAGASRRLAAAMEGLEGLRAAGSIPDSRILRVCEQIQSELQNFELMHVADGFICGRRGEFLSHIIDLIRSDPLLLLPPARYIVQHRMMDFASIAIRVFALAGCV
jgi:hypothetical protein